MLSGDSTVNSYSFDGRKVEFLFEDEESEETYSVVVETPIIFSESSRGIGCVHMRIEDSKGKLDIDKNSGRYFLPGTFSKQMAAINNGYHILAGLKADEYPKLFLLGHESKILLCPIKGSESVSINIA